MEPDNFVKTDNIIVEAVDSDYLNYIEVINLDIVKNAVGRKYIKINNYLIDDYQLQKILDKLKGNK